MKIDDIVIPSNIRAITVDLWNTLLCDSDYAIVLNNIRENIVDEILHKKRVITNTSIKDSFIEERKRYQYYEKNGEFLPFKERIGFITGYKLSKGEINSVSKQFDSASQIFYPKIRNDLLDQLKQWKTKYKLALISNTGMTSSLVIKEFLNMYGIYNLFDEIIFSEDIALCKPSKKIFYLASKKLHCSVSSILHIGDSLFFDFYAAQNAGFYAIRIEGNEYFKSW